VDGTGTQVLRVLAIFKMDVQEKMEAFAQPERGME